MNKDTKCQKGFEWMLEALLEGFRMGPTPHTKPDNPAENRRDKMKNAQTLNEVFASIADRPRADWAGMTKEKAQAEARALTARLQGQGIRAKAYKTRTAKSAAMTHVLEVQAAKKKAIADLADSRNKLRRQKELNAAKSAAFTGEMHGYSNAQDVLDRAADLEADEAEARAMGKAQKVTGKTRPKKGAKLLVQYENMAQGPERIAFWNANKSAIFRALNER